MPDACVGVPTSIAFQQTRGYLDDLSIGALRPLLKNRREWLRNFRQLPEELENDLLFGRRSDLGLPKKEIRKDLLRRSAEDGLGFAKTVVAGLCPSSCVPARQRGAVRGASGRP